MEPIVIARMINGVLFNATLSDEEITKIYEAKENEYYKKGILAKWSEIHNKYPFHYPERQCPFTPEEIDEVVEVIKDYLENDEIYWEQYWANIDDAVKRYYREKNSETEK